MNVDFGKANGRQAVSHFFFFIFGLALQNFQQLDVFGEEGGVIGGQIDGVFVFRTGKFEFVINFFFYDHGLDAGVTEGMTAHGEHSGRVVVGEVALAVETDEVFL